MASTRFPSHFFWPIFRHFLFAEKNFHLWVMINSTTNTEKRAEVLWKREYHLIPNDEILIELANTTENMNDWKKKQDFIKLLWNNKNELNNAKSYFKIFLMNFNERPMKCLIFLNSVFSSTAKWSQGRTTHKLKNAF